MALKNESSLSFNKLAVMKELRDCPQMSEKDKEEPTKEEHSSYEENKG